MADNCTCHSNDDGIVMPDCRHLPHKLPVLRWVGSTNVCPCCGTMNVYMKRSDGTCFRFKMTPEDALALASVIRGVVAKAPAKPGTSCPQCGLQRPKSSGSPQSDGLPQAGQSVVPPTSSSRA